MDLAGRRGRSLPGLRLDRRGEEEAARSVSGISCFIVERAFKGFSSGTLKEKWGILAGNTGFFKMDDMDVPAENLLGREGEGFKIAMFALDQGRFTVAAGATGLDPRVPRCERDIRAASDEPLARRSPSISWSRR